MAKETLSLQYLSVGFGYVRYDDRCCQKGILSECVCVRVFPRNKLSNTAKAFRIRHYRWQLIIDVLFQFLTSAADVFADADCSTLASVVLKVVHIFEKKNKI